MSPKDRNGNGGQGHTPTPVTGAEVMDIQAAARARANRKGRSARGNGPVPHDDDALVAHMFPAPPAEPAELVFRGEIRALGRSGNLYYFTNTVGQTQALGARDLSRTSGLYQLAPRSWWVQQGFCNDEGHITGAYVDAAMAELMLICDRAGVYDPARARGRGIWWSPEHGAIVHLGDTLIVGGRRVHPRDFREHEGFVYEARARLDVKPEHPLDLEGARLLDTALRSFNWTEPTGAAIMGGWLVCAILSGALEWRPHLYLTGPAAAGKSYLHVNGIDKVLGRFQIGAQASSTEAGLRQLVGPDALPLSLDEQDPDDPQGIRALQRIIELLRACASSSDKPVVKGSTTHNAVAFQAQSCGLITSVSTALRRAADESRFMEIELRPHHGEAYAALRRAVVPISRPHYRDRFFWRVVHAAKRVRHDAALLAAELASRSSTSRAGDLYGTTLAGYRVLVSDQPLADAAEAKAFVDEVFGADAAFAPGARKAEQADHVSLISDLLGATLQVEVADGRGGTRNVRRTVNQLVRIAAHDRDDRDPVTHVEAEAALSQIGLKVEGFTGAGFLLIANQSRGLDAILADHPLGHPKARYRVLRRIEDAETREKVVRFATGVSRCIAVPLTAILDDGG